MNGERACFQIRDDGLALHARVTPGVAACTVRGLWRGPNKTRLFVRVAAPPDKGKANAAVEKLVAGAFGLPKSAVSVTAGHKNRAKTLLLSGDAEALVERLKGLLGEDE